MGGMFPDSICHLLETLAAIAAVLLQELFEMRPGYRA
jgi:hypothetical protein